MEPLRILLVDDDALFVEATAGLLRDAGYEVVTATGYFAALDILDSQAQKIDVLVTDVALDSGNGIALSRKARYHNQGIAAVYITGYDLDMSEAGGPVLRKPVTTEKLTAAIDRAMAGAL